MRSKVLSVMLGMVFLASAASAEMIQIKGSDTLINMVQKLAEVYMQKNPGVEISVTGGGSGTGIAALINDKCDIANASRGIKAKEVSKAQENGIDPSRVVVAVDGLSVIVNGNSSITRLSVPQLGKIFRGEITNWSEVGGDNMPITLYGRQSNSGTFAFFRSAVLKGEYASTMNRMNGNSQIVEAVKADPSGIGYVGVGYVKDATGLNVLEVALTANGTYASPLDSVAVNAGNYPIARPLNQYLNGAPKGAARKFIEFELSYEGQKVVEDLGFFPVPADYQAYNAKLGF